MVSTLVKIGVGALVAAPFVTYYVFPHKLLELMTWAQKRKAGFTEKKIKIGKTEFFYLENDNRSGQCVLLLHGFSAYKETWGQVAVELRSKYRVITLDLPGHGKTTRE